MHAEDHFWGKRNWAIVNGARYSYTLSSVFTFPSHNLHLQSNVHVMVSQYYTRTSSSLCCFILVHIIAVCIYNIHEVLSSLCCCFLNLPEGLPDKLESINITSNCSSIALVWEAPGGDLTLANDQELAYRVSVYNTTGEEDSPENASRIVQVQDSQFEYTATHPNPAHTFEFVVTGVSPLGDGPPSDRIKAHFTFGKAVRYGCL